MKNKNKMVLKLKKLLPGYKISAPKSGLSIFISHKVADMDSWTKMNTVVRDVARKNHLDEVGSGTGFGCRDWEFVDLDIKKHLDADAKELYRRMKSFFKKWNNTYCSSSKAYDYIEKMRAMIETDEV